MACLLLLRELAKTAGFDVIAAHFDHQLRPGSGADLAFVRACCAELGVPCFTGEGDVARAAAERHTSLEETARIMRYQFLAFVAGKERAECIATGHTADDQAETVLQRILRGTGVRGLRGMLSASPVPGASAQHLVRPLLVLTRSETAAVCTSAGIVPRVDESNADLAYGRNRVRLETLPFLRGLNPSLDRALLGVAESAREVFDGIEKQAMAIQPLERPALGSIFVLENLRALPNEAVALVIEREAGVHNLKIEVNRTRVRNLRAVLDSGTGTAVFGQAQVDVSCGRVRIGPELVPPPPFEAKVLNVPGVTVVSGWRVTVATDPLPAQPGVLSAVVAGGAMVGALRLRPLAAGDRLRWHGGQRKVADVLAGAKVPRWERQQICAVADAHLVVALLGAPDALQPQPDPHSLFVRAERLPAGG